MKGRAKRKEEETWRKSEDGVEDEAPVEGESEVYRGNDARVSIF